MILDQIVEDKIIRLKEQKKRAPLKEVRKSAEAVRREGKRFYHALKKEGLSLIGEFKRASPSLGRINGQIDLEQRMAEYNVSVDAVSCLTEEDHFLGSLYYLKKIRTMTALPVLRKDFMIDPYQFYEAKAAGADAVLLIAAILDDGMLRDFGELAKELKLDALVEVHDEEELWRVLRLDAEIIGVNNRDLQNFEIRLETTKRLARLMPEDKVFVSESGITCDEDVRELTACGVDALLVGRALMEAAHPKELAKRWKYQCNRRQDADGTYRLRQL